MPLDENFEGIRVALLAAKDNVGIVVISYPVQGSNHVSGISGLLPKSFFLKRCLSRILDSEVRRVFVTALREAKRPQRELFEPSGRVFASAVQRALERSKNRLFAGRESWSGVFGQQPDSTYSFPRFPVTRAVLSRKIDPEVLKKRG
jgi:hypothetical protein